MHLINPKKITYVVANEHTLGFIHPDLPDYIQIMHTSILRGSYWNGLSGAQPVSGNTIRQASLKDFEDYRVYFTHEDFCKYTGFEIEYERNLFKE